MSQIAAVGDLLCITWCFLLIISSAQLAKIVMHPVRSLKCYVKSGLKFQLMKKEASQLRPTVLAFKLKRTNLAHSRHRRASMEQPTKFKRIIWAVDALQDCSEIETRCLDAIRALDVGSKADIEPVYVVPPQHLTTVSKCYECYGKEAVERLNNRLSVIDSPKFSPPKAIDKSVMSTTGAAKALSDYAEDTATDLIVVGTHCRKGISRFFWEALQNLFFSTRVFRCSW